MKKNNNRILLYIIAAGITFTACRKDYFYPGINTDPTRVTPSELIPSVLLTGAESAIGYTVGGDISRFAGIMDQQLFGYSRQAASYENYIYANSDFSNLWANVYDPGLNNLAVLRNIADSAGDAYYSGISRVLLAYEYGLTTDLWGDIPLTNALQGTKALQPTYDKQQDIYPLLQKMLDSAITFLSASDGGPSVPSTDDFIYGGDPAPWTSFAYALKARYYIHLSKKDANYADEVLAVLPKAFSASAQDAKVPFFNSETQSNPWYQYIEQRSDIAVLEGKAQEIWESLNDPRDSAYNVQDLNIDILTDLLAGIDAPVTLESYSELEFIAAEAYSVKNDMANAVKAYNIGVTEAFNNAGVAMPVNYLTVTAPLNGATHSARLPQIITQKYLSLYTQPEAFNDLRRTGYPVLKPITGSNLPQRFLYPQTELDYNAANVPTGTTLFTKVWWAQ